MDYLKKELNKILPLALLFGAIGGVLLIVVSNLFVANLFSVLISYILIISASVYILNKMRYRKELKGSLLYGSCVYLVMTAIAFLDMIMNTNPDFVNPMFENMLFFVTILATAVFFSGSIAFLFKKNLLH